MASKALQIDTSAVEVEKSPEEPIKFGIPRIALYAASQIYGGTQIGLAPIARVLPPDLANHAQARRRCEYRDLGVSPQLRPHVRPKVQRNEGHRKLHFDKNDVGGVLSKRLAVAS